MKAAQSAARGVRRLLATLALLFAGGVVGPHRRERAKRLSGPGGPHRSRLCRRRLQRHLRAPRRTETLRHDRLAGGDRKSSGGKRPARRRIIMLSGAVLHLREIAAPDVCPPLAGPERARARNYAMRRRKSHSRTCRIKYGKRPNEKHSRGAITPELCLTTTHQKRRA